MSNSKIKIAFIIDTISTPTAGTEKQLLYLLDGIDKTKFTPYLVCLKKSKWLSKNKLNVCTYFLNVNSLLSYLPKFFAFRKLHKKENFDIVQTFFKEGNIFGTIAAKLAGTKIIISSRRNIGYWHNDNHIKLLRFLSKWTTSYLCNSNAAQEMTIKVENADPMKFQIIYNGLHLDKFESMDQSKRNDQRLAWHINKDETLIGTVANLRSVKNIDMLISTASKLLEEFTHLKFVVIGEGDLKKSLQQKIDKLNMTNNFILAGRFNDITSPLAAFDIAVMPSLSESFSNSLIEYMAAGLPIVASDAGGNIEAITNEETGLLYSNNDKNGLYNCLRKIILEKQVYGSMAKQAREKAFKNYSVEKMIKNHQNFYFNLMKEANEKVNLSNL